MDKEQNLAVAPGQGQGLYALMSSIPIPLHFTGWNLFAYPVQESRAVSVALTSIPTTTYGAVYSYEGSNHWSFYSPAVPHWVNDLNRFDFEFGRGYWITTTQPITLYLKGAAQENVNAAASPAPPSIFYGPILAGDGEPPLTGTTVEGWIGGVLCGSTPVQPMGGEWVYALQVAAASGREGCGSPGASVEIRLGGQKLPVIAQWDNGAIQKLPLPQTPLQKRLYLPLVNADDR